MSIVKEFYGKTPEGSDAYLFTLTNSNGTTAKITNYGGIIVSLLVKDKAGRFADVVLGCDSLEDYFKQTNYLGALIGRHGNRIEDAKFELNGVEYNLFKNDGNNHLHGGAIGFDRKLWEPDVVNESGKECLKLSYFSKDMEEGYPGNLNVKVTYRLTEDDALEIHYFAVTDKDTVVNLTNHSYFNLSGHGSGDVLEHQIMINAHKFTVINDECIPTGEIRDVKGTPMDLTSLTPIGPGINSGDEQIKFGGGYDHNWVLDVSGKAPEKAAEVYDPKTGRVMEVYTTNAGIQFYSGNFLDGTVTGKGGAVYGKRGGLCLETQYFPNSLKHKHFPSPVLKAGEEYNHTTVYKFTTK